MRRYDLEQIVYGLTEHTDIRPTNIIEIGSRDGHDAKSLAQIFNLPDESCYVFEANPEAAESIMKTYPKFHLYNNLVSDTAGEFIFNIEPDNIGASSMYSKINPSAGMKTVKVEAVTMADFIESENIQTLDCVKLDVEGATLNVLKSFGKHLDKLQAIQIESEHIQIWGEGSSLFPEVYCWLVEHGYVMLMFTLLRQVQSDSFWVKRERLLR